MHLFLAVNLLRRNWDQVSWYWYELGGVVAVQILLQLFIHWNMDIKSFFMFHRSSSLNTATHCKVLPAAFSGAKEVVPLQRRVLEGETEQELSFVFRKQRFVYNKEAQAFEKLKYPTRKTFGEFRKESGYSSETKVMAALERWGPNVFEVPVPQPGQLMREQMLAPFFVFQVFCVSLWCMDEFWYYSIFTLFMLIMFEWTVVQQRLRNLSELRALQTPKQAIMVYRHGKWDRLPGDALVPGDVISIGRPAGAGGAEEKVVPADALLLAGTCIVEEAVLTGESTPQWKAPISSPAGDSLDASELGPAMRLSIKRDKNHVLFGGTKILQHTGDKDARIRTPDGGCLAVVLRTGFETAQGRLMRTILYSTERVTANNWETGLFILFLLVFALAAAAYVLVHALKDPDRNRFKLFLNCTMIITSVIPPELPMELSIAVNTSLLALARKAVYCTEPFRITLAGKVAACCFDKTGTLTSDNMVLDGVTGLPGRSRELVTDVKQAGQALLRVMAACQSLIQVEGELVGDPLEKAAFQATGWSHSSGALTSFKREAGGKETVTILHRFHFSSALKRMAVLLRVEDEASKAPSFWVVVKGAPEMVQTFLKNTPDDYEACYKEYAAQGARVIALAFKQLGSEVTADAFRSLTREQVEADLDFAGFAIFQCPLKPESEPALRMLKESSHQLVMITGDAPLTACHAAGRVHIVDRPVLIMSHRGPAVEKLHKEDEDILEPDSHFEWVSPDEATIIPFSRDRHLAIELASQWDLCIAGTGLHHIHQIGAEATFIPLAQVFARVSPDQKELIIKTLRSAGLVTLMCGDGTNDVGALKTAHVGVALLAPSEAQTKQHQKQVAAAAAAKRGSAPGSRASSRRTSEPGTRSGAVPAGPASSSGVVARAGPSTSTSLAHPAGAAGPAGRGRTSPAKAGTGSKMLEELRKSGKPVTPKMEEMATWLDSLDKGDDGTVPMVKPGDASMASPFTAKQASVMPCTDIIKQGRCTLVTMVQMFKILGLLCLSTAYSLSVQYLQGVKLGDLQATVSGMLSAGLFFVISNSKALPTLSPERPHPNIFCAYVFLSMLGQFAVHLAFLIFMYQGALAAMPAEDMLTPDSEFKPNLVNTVCFLVSFIIQLSTFGVNYMGHPFNTALRDNKMLWKTLQYGSLFALVLSLNIVEGLGSWFSLVPIPGQLRGLLVGLGVADFALTFGWEHFLRWAFPAKKPPQKGYMAFVDARTGRPSPNALRLKAE
ncbi:hypothetical protein WJX72_000825 [[Myrmecia] bisecta]|uniref:P-type ATPase A domain-containing protein n=1 Tax=[Myrmecia] bisecta TaxID=41462 RepID=A0AAW1QE33_9CHLO